MLDLHLESVFLSQRVALGEIPFIKHISGYLTIMDIYVMFEADFDVHDRAVDSIMCSA